MPNTSSYYKSAMALYEQTVAVTREKFTLELRCVPRLRLAIVEPPLQDSGQQGRLMHFEAEVPCPGDKKCFNVYAANLWMRRTDVSWLIEADAAEAHLFMAAFLSALDAANGLMLERKEARDIAERALDYWRCAVNNNCSVDALKRGIAPIQQ